LLGADALKDLPTWKQPEKLVRLCRLGVAVRTPDNTEDVLSRIPPEFRSHIDVISMRAVDVSASEIREHLGRGLGIGQWVTPQVAQYIKEHKLYRS
jgi:nicotinate-nucleotide adenylyltransferase